MRWPTVGHKNKGVQITWTGFQEVENGLRLMMNQRKELVKFLNAESEKLKLEAQKTVPYDVGRLYASHKKLPVTVGNDKFTAGVSAGGTSEKGRMVDYAAAVHEGAPNNPRYRHMPPRPWLRKALEKIAMHFEKRVAKAIRIEKLGL